VRATIPLPLVALEDMQFIDGMMERLSEKTRQHGFLIAVDCIDLVNDYDLVRRIGAQLAQRNIGIAINDIDAEGAALAASRDLPVVEMKVNRRLFRGCADDRIKQAHCADIIAIAHSAAPNRSPTAWRPSQTS
jgi:EAL domain-containing protein (putative c-di-GMP-specific phosphodiesterase class I)